jgi:hypothetical protein
MADLVFLSSDEELTAPDIVPKIVPEKDGGDDEFDDDSSRDEFGNDFEFGGLLVRMLLSVVQVSPLDCIDILDAKVS